MENLGLKKPYTGLPSVFIPIMPFCLVFFFFRGGGTGYFGGFLLKTTETPVKTGLRNRKNVLCSIRGSLEIDSAACFC